MTDDINVFDWPLSNKIRDWTNFFWASSSCIIHSLAPLDFGAGVELPFGCLIVQNRQTMQSIGRSMVWTLEDNMVDGCFVLLRHTHRPQRRPYRICTSRSGNVRPWCGGGWAGPRLFLGRSFRGGGWRCPELKCGVLWGFPPTPHKWVSRFEAPCICTRGTGDRWMEQVSRLHGAAF